MRFEACLCFFVGGLVFVATPVAGQNVNLNSPPEINVQHRKSAEEMRDRLSASQVQKDAKELTELCTAVTTDMNSVKQGLLPKDALERLKRVEKLSKRMREELARASPER